MVGLQAQSTCFNEPKELLGRKKATKPVFLDLQDGLSVDDKK